MSQCKGIYMEHANKHGFTLIEIMIAIVILGLLVGIGGYSVMNILKNAKVKTTKQTLKGIQQAINMFQVDTSTYPEKLTDLAKRPANEEVAANWGPAPYMDKEPGNDAWNNKYVYKLTPEGENPYELYSYGPDGKKTPKNEWLNVWKLK